MMTKAGSEGQLLKLVYGKKVYNREHALRECVIIVEKHLLFNTVDLGCINN